MWLASVPYIQCPDCLRMTNVGPAPHFSRPSAGSDVIGTRNAGPTPQITPRGWAGETKKDAVTSLRPKLASPPGVSGTWLTVGTMTRVIRFHSLLRLEGTTGWRLST